MDVQTLLKTAFIYSKPISKPTLKEVVKQTRFQIRAGQLCMAIAAFGGLAGATFNAKYPFPDVGPYGVQFMVLVSISSFFVSLAGLLIYLFPARFYISPQRYPKFSRLEVFFDIFFVIAWAVASSTMASHGLCPDIFFESLKTGNPCLPWNLSLAFGFLAAILFFATTFLGIVDLFRHGFSTTDYQQGTWRHWDLPN